MAKEKKSRDPNIQFSFWQRIAFGMGLGGGGLVAAIGTFILVYYTDVVHIDPGVAASVIAASKVLDGLSDIVAGRLVDRTNTKLGKGRPWLIRMVLPALVCFILMWTVPSGSSLGVQVAYTFITYNLFTTVCFTMVSVAYSSMQSLVTQSQYERGLNVVTGMTIYTIIMLVVNSTFLKITTSFGGGDAYTRGGWTKTGILFGILYSVLILTAFFFSKEMETKAGAAVNGGRQVGMGRTLKALLSNKYWVEYVIALVTNGIGNTFTMGAAVYYCRFVLKDYNYYSTISVGLYLAMFLGIVSTFIFIKKIGKRNTAIIGLVILLFGTLAAAVLPKTYLTTLITMIIRGFGTGFPSALGTAVLQDTLTYGKWKNGFDMVGMGNAACTFTSKVGTGLGTAALGWILQAGGYNGELAVQSESALRAISLSFAWLPLIFVIATLVCFILYKLDKEYDRYAADLAEGRFSPDAETF